MRLIDADALCEDLMRRWSVSETRKEELIKAVMADIVTPIVVSQPTIEPERQGRWIKIVNNPYGHYTCDRCGEIIAFETNYCPNCGAYMRGEK